MPLPAANSSASASSSRRPTGHPKTGRKQYTACGGCRLRRVRCDLKDLQEAATGDVPQACTNCSERGINCVDEYMELKAARQQISRSQQGYADYITQGAPLLSTGSVHSSVSPERYLVPASTIPQPHPDFFRSTFFRQFSLKHPIFDPTDFHFLHPGNPQFDIVSIERKVLAMVLVAWAASFGLNERGVTADLTAPRYAGLYDMRSVGDGSESDNHAMRTDALVSDILRLVDSHGLLRNPTWDGVRLLLLLWPLTQRVQRSLERITTYETILSQIHALCHFEHNTVMPMGQDAYNTFLPRARVFWYAYVHESISNALRGRRLVMDEDDLNGFQRTLPPQSFPVTQPPAHLLHPMPGSESQTIGLATPATLSDAIQALADSRYRSHSRVFLLYQLTTHHFNLTLNVAAACRRIHNLLTGPVASRVLTDNSASVSDAEMMAIWDGLERAWNDFEGAREHGLWNGGIDEICSAVEVDIYLSGWQIFVFECQNIIREALKQRLLSQPSRSPPVAAFPTAQYVSPPSNLFDLHMHATHNCRVMLPNILTILKRHLQTPPSALFHADTGLVRDGCAFAGFMLAQGDLESDDNGGSLHPGMSLEAGIEICAHALDAMDWTFSRSAKMKEMLMVAWGARKSRDITRHTSSSASAQQWSSHSQNQPYLAYAPTAHSHDSFFYPDEQGHESQPWIDIQGDSSQSGLHGEYTDTGFMFSPDGSFGYDPTS